MQGKILADNLISGNDGNRYNFSIDEVKNLGNQTISSLINAEVDFEVEGTEAKSIFIAKNFAQQEDINSIKTKAYFYIAGSILGALIPFIGWVLAIIGFIFMILAIIPLGRISGAPLLKNLLLSWLIAFVGASIMSLSFLGGFFGGLAGGGSGMTTGATVGIVVGVLLIISSWIFLFFYYRDLSQVTHEKMFLYVFVVRAISSVLVLVPFVNWILAIAAGIVELIAWINFKEIRRKENL